MHFSMASFVAISVIELAKSVEVIPGDTQMRPRVLAERLADRANGGFVAAWTPMVGRIFRQAVETTLTTWPASWRRKIGSAAAMP